MVLDFFLNYVRLLGVNLWSVKNEMIFNFFRLNTDERITLYIVRIFGRLLQSRDNKLQRPHNELVIVKSIVTSKYRDQPFYCCLKLFPSSISLFTLIYYLVPLRNYLKIMLSRYQVLRVNNRDPTNLKQKGSLSIISKLFYFEIGVTLKL